MDSAAPPGPPEPDALKTLAAGTLHDVNNLLVLVLGCAELVLEDPTLSAGSRGLVQEIVEASERAGSLAHQMLALGRPGGVVPASNVDVGAVLRRAEPLLRRAAGRAVALTTDFGQAPLPVRAQTGDLDRIVANLVSNARDAMPRGGALSIHVAAARIVDEPSPREVVRITVTDTGHGIAPEIRERIFEAFATTRPDGRNWGLGLAVVRAVVHRLGGVVRVTSAPGEGTTFVIDLPFADPPTDRPPAP